MFVIYRLIDLRDKLLPAGGGVACGTGLLVTEAGPTMVPVNITIVILGQFLSQAATGATTWDER